MPVCSFIQVWRNWFHDLKSSVEFGAIYIYIYRCIPPPPREWVPAMASRTQAGLHWSPGLVGSLWGPWDHCDEGGSDTLEWDGTALVLKMWPSLGRSGGGVEIVLGLPWAFPWIQSWSTEFPKKIWLFLEVILDQNTVISKDQKSREIKVATDHLELINPLNQLCCRQTYAQGTQSSHGTRHRGVYRSARWTGRLEGQQESLSGWRFIFQ